MASGDSTAPRTAPELDMKLVKQLTGMKLVTGIKLVCRTGVRPQSLPSVHFGNSKFEIRIYTFSGPPGASSTGKGGTARGPVQGRGHGAPSTRKGAEAGAVEQRTGEGTRPFIRPRRDRDRVEYQVFAPWGG